MTSLAPRPRRLITLSTPPIPSSELGVCGVRDPGRPSVSYVRVSVRARKDEGVVDFAGDEDRSLLRAVSRISSSSGRHSGPKRGETRYTSFWGCAEPSVAVEAVVGLPLVLAASIRVGGDRLSLSADVEDVILGEVEIGSVGGVKLALISNSIDAAESSSGVWGPLALVKVR